MKSISKSGFLENENFPEIRVTTWSTGSAELKDHVLARVGFNRMGHQVAPGLYSIGHPGPARAR